MIKKCYIVEISTALETLFEQLDDYGIDYECEEYMPAPDEYLEVILDCVEGELVFVEHMFAPYV